MKKWQKLLSLLLAISMMASLAACGSSSSSSSSSTESSSSEETTTTEETTETETSEDASDEFVNVSTIEGDAVYGGTLNMTMQSLDLVPDPAANDSQKWQLWFETLWAIDITLDESEYQDETSSASRLTGQIADTWEWDSEAQTFTVVIRDDIYFQDKSVVGMEEYDVYGARNVTADDIVWSYTRILGIGEFTEPVECDENWPSDLYMIESVEATDTYTVVFHFNTNTDISASDFMLVSVNIGGPEWDTLDEDQQADWHYACGTGAYILTDYELNSFAVFTKSENYYDTDTREGYEGNQLPYIDTITMSQITENANQITQFIAGNIDIIGWNKSYLSDSECTLLEDSLSSDDYVKYTYLGQPFCICYKMSANEELQDVNVRAALQMAINMEEINEAYYGFTTEAQVGGLFSITTLFSSVDDWSDELMATWTYDLEGAKALMEEAGYADGFTLYVATISDYTELLTLIQGYLAEINVTLDITVCADSTAMEVYGSDETAVQGVMGAWGMSSTFFASIMWSTTGPQYNSFAYDAVVEDFFDQLNAVTSEDEKNEVAQAFDMYMAEMHYVLVISPYSHNPVYVSSKIGGLNSAFMYANRNCYELLIHAWDTTAE